jgi:hypothetical protein
LHRQGVPTGYRGRQAGQRPARRAERWYKPPMRRNLCLIALASVLAVGCGESEIDRNRKKIRELHSQAEKAEKRAGELGSVEKKLQKEKRRLQQETEP